MALTTNTPAQTRRLTRRENVKAELAITTASDDALFDRLIDQASRAIERYCRRPFPREVYTETLGGFGEVELMLARTPIVAVSSVLYDLDVITDYVVNDADAGILYRQVGWFWTAQVLSGLVGKQRWPGIGDPLPRQEEPRFTVGYTAGYLLPSQDLVGGTVSVAAADSSFNDSASGFPKLLQAGDLLVASGFQQAANNGTFAVVGAPSAGKVRANAVLADEAAGAGKLLQVSSLPPDIEKAAIETVKAWYIDRQKSPHTRRERVSDLDMEWTDPVGVESGLPVNAAALLRPYVRAA